MPLNNSRWTTTTPSVPTIFHVSELNGSDSNNGGSESPLKTMQAAADACYKDAHHKGDFSKAYTVIVSDGTGELVIGVTDDELWVDSLLINWTTATQFALVGPAINLSFGVPPVTITSLIVGGANSVVMQGFSFQTSTNDAKLVQVPSGSLDFLHLGTSSTSICIETSADVLVGTVTLVILNQFISLDFFDCEIRAFQLPIFNQVANNTSSGSEFEFTNCRILPTNNGAQNDGHWLFELDSGTDTGSNFNFSGLRATNSNINTTAASADTQGILSYSGNSMFFVEFLNQCQLWGGSNLDTFYMIDINIVANDFGQGGIVQISGCEANFRGGSHRDVWAIFANTTDENVAWLSENNRSNDRFPPSSDASSNARLVNGDFTMTLTTQWASMVARSPGPALQYVTLGGVATSVSTVPLTLANAGATITVGNFDLGKATDSRLFNIMIGTDADGAPVTTDGAAVRYVPLSELRTHLDFTPIWNTDNDSVVIENNSATNPVVFKLYGPKAIITA